MNREPEIAWPRPTGSPPFLKPLLIGLHGKARSGKDTFAQALMRYEPFVRMAFADPLKTAVAGLFNIPLEVAFSDDKNRVLHPWGLTLRNVLQRFGTEAMRNTFGPDFWIERWQAEYDQTKHRSVVITDCRFSNEAARIRSLGGIIVHVQRDHGDGLRGSEAAHASEQALPPEPGDYIVCNDGSLRDLDLAAGILLVALRT